MLWESSKMEQRYDAVLGVIRDGFTVSEVAQEFGVSRQGVDSWIKRYEEGGLEALAEPSSRPATSPAKRACWSCAAVTRAGERCACATNSNERA